MRKFFVWLTVIALIVSIIGTGVIVFTTTNTATTGNTNTFSEEEIQSITTSGTLDSSQPQ